MPAEEPRSDDRKSENTSAGDHSVDFRAFQSRLQRGESEAVEQLFDDYSRQLVDLAGRNIHPALLKRFDGEDVVQSVFRTFFRRQEAGSFQIQHRQQMWQLLVTLTLCKTRSHARRHTADCRDAQADQAIIDDRQMLDRAPSPEDAMALWEEIDCVIDGLPEKAGEIIALSLEGRSKTEIAKILNLSRQSIHRILTLIRQRLENRFEALFTENPSISEKKPDSM